MRYTEKQRARFKSRFRQKRQYEVALLVPLGGAVVMLAIGERHAEALSLQPLMMALGTAGLVLAAAGFHWLNWRCPACEKFLGRDLNPSHCPGCEVALRSQ